VVAKLTFHDPQTPLWIEHTFRLACKQFLTSIKLQLQKPCFNRMPNTEHIVVMLLKAINKLVFKLLRLVFRILIRIHCYSCRYM